MMRLTTDKGIVTISSEVFTNIAGMAASSCFRGERYGGPLCYGWTGAFVTPGSHGKRRAGYL